VWVWVWVVRLCVCVCCVCAVVSEFWCVSKCVCVCVYVCVQVSDRMILANDLFDVGFHDPTQDVSKTLFFETLAEIPSASCLSPVGTKSELGSGCDKEEIINVQLERVMSLQQTPTATLHQDPKMSDVDSVKDLPVEGNGQAFAGGLPGTPEEEDKGRGGVFISVVGSVTSSVKSCLSTPCSSPIRNVQEGRNISCHHSGEAHDGKEGVGDDGDMSVKSSACTPVKSGTLSSRSSAAGSTWSTLAAKTRVGIGLYFQRSQYGLSVKSIVQGSAADVCGCVSIGDVIVAVDGESVQNASLTGSCSEKSVASTEMF
jgi:hypothetical protein